MSESNEHRQLVVDTASAIEHRFPELSLLKDIQERPGDPVPPIINGHRPDIYGTYFGQHSPVTHLIAEAKTLGDIDRSRTGSQIASYIDYLEQIERGLFLLAVNGSGAGIAKSTLRFAHVSSQIQLTRLVVFDTMDLWYFDSGSGRWHLG